MVLKSYHYAQNAGATSLLIKFDAQIAPNNDDIHDLS